MKEITTAMRTTLIIIAGVLLCLPTLYSGSRAGEWVPAGGTGSGNNYTKATNLGSIVNTRHDFTQAYLGGGWAWMMDGYMNRYGEVCVYCHTPHRASGAIRAPLWNRTVSAASSYTSYSSSTLSQTADNPGSASLTCLSCHDGTLPVDSIINMPGSNGSSGTQETTVSTAFLDGWDNPASWLQGGFGPACGNSPCYHSALGAEGNTGEQTGTCMECHNKDNSFGLPEFSVFIIGKDLRNDHPVGVRYPDPAIYDFQPGLVNASGYAFFDQDGDAHLDSNELRLYDEGDGPQVECATCHDPHGVRSGGAGSLLIPSFLRVPSNNSSICLTCHIK